MKSARKKSRENRRPVPAAPAPCRLAAWLVPALVALLTFISFLPTLQNGFVDWDDDRNIFNNPDYRGLGLTELRWMFTTLHMSLYRPLAWMTLGLDYSLWGMSPAGYHATSVLFHAANAALVYWIALRLYRLAVPSVVRAALHAHVAAGLAALLFSLHPLAVEPVAWISARSDPVAAFFIFLSLLFYLGAAEGGAYRRSIFAAWLFFALSLLSKSSGMTFPLVLLALDVYPLRRLDAAPGKRLRADAARVWLEKVPFFALSLAAAVVSVVAKKQSGVLADSNLWANVPQALYAAGVYIWKALLPVDLSPVYPVPQTADVAHWPLVLFPAAVVALTIAVIVLRRRLPSAATAWFCCLALLLPSSGLVRYGPQLVADRYAYLPNAVLALLVSGAALYLWQRRPRTFLPVSALAAVLLCVLGFLTWKQTEIWRDSAALWRHAVAVAPESGVARYNLGLVAEAEGDPGGAMENYRQAIALDPADAEAHYNLARLLARGGKTDEAIVEYRKAAAAAPGDADTHNNLALLLLKRGDSGEARRELELTLAIDPAHARAHYNLGKLLASAGRFDEAIAHFHRALDKEPNVAEIHENLARALAQQGKKEEAMREYEEAVRIMKGAQR
jgi:protein O-mannosyl-transferase